MPSDELKGQPDPTSEVKKTPQSSQSSDTPRLPLAPIHLPSPPAPIHVPFSTQYLGSSPRKHRTGRMIFTVAPQCLTLSPTLPNISAAQSSSSSSGTSASAHVVLHHGGGDMSDYVHDIFDQDAFENNGQDGSQLLPPINHVGPLIPAPNTPGVLSFEVGFLRNDMTAVQTSANLNREELVRQAAVIEQLTTQNEKLFQYLHQAGERLGALEQENIELRQSLRGGELAASESYIASRSSTPSNLVEHSRAVTPDVSVLELGDEEIIAIKTSLSPRKTKQSPTKVTKSKGIRVPRSLGLKRKSHNLNDILPNMYTVVPAVPLTDTEIIVYFFNAVSRPQVAIRLNVRGWGPAKITDMVNSHRELDPPYLRNTCSVKCTTAQRKGIKDHGAQWDTDLRAAFMQAGRDDVTATDLIRDMENECDEPGDIDVLALLKGLKGHPEQGGIFTQCVRWCEETQTSWPLSEIHNLAESLEAGVTPTPPAARSFPGLATLMPKPEAASDGGMETE